MGVPVSEVGYTPVMPRREDHEVHKDMWCHWTKKNIFTKSLAINHSTTGRLSWNLQTVSLNKLHVKEDEVFEGVKVKSVSIRVNTSRNGAFDSTNTTP